MSIDINKVKNEFNRIKSLGLIANIRSSLNDGAIGNTFEDQLGVIENNLKDPDFEGWEVKTKRKFTGSWMSLYTKKPTHPEKGDDYMRKKFGVPDKRYPNINCFRTSLHCNRYSLVYKKFKIKMNVNRSEKKLRILFCDLNENIIDKNVYWSFDDLENGSKKIEKMFVIEAEQKNENEKQFFHYTNAKVFMDYKGFNNFLNLLDEGLIRYDNRLGVHGPTTKLAGKPHNHGGGLRINPKNVHKLYNVNMDL